MEEQKVLDRVCGVVLDDREIAVVEMSRRGKNYELLSAGRAMISGLGYLQNGKIKDQTGIILKFRELTKSAQISSSLASINLPTLTLFLKAIPFQDEVLETFSDWFKWECSKQILGKPDDYNIQVQSMGIQISESEMLYLLGASPKSLLNERLTILKTLDLIPQYADPDPIAVYNGFIKTFPTPDQGNYLFIELEPPVLTLFATFSGRFIYGGSRMVQTDWSSLDKEKPSSNLFANLTKEIKEFAKSVFSIYAPFPQDGNGIIPVGYLSLSQEFKLALQEEFNPPIVGTLSYDNKKVKVKMGKDFDSSWGSFIKPIGLAIRALENAE